MKNIFIIIFSLLSVAVIAQTTNSEEVTDPDIEKELAFANSIVDEVIVNCLGDDISVEVNEYGTKIVQLPEDVSIIDLQKCIDEIISKYPEIYILHPWSGSQDNSFCYATYTIYYCSIYITYHSNFRDKRNSCYFKASSN